MLPILRDAFRYEDNGEDIIWNDADEYCDALTLGGYSDWGLAGIDDLEALYDEDVSYRPRDFETWQVHIAAPIQLTGMWQWSADRQEIAGSALGFYFFGGYRFSTSVGSYYNRALCVRGAQAE